MDPSSANTPTNTFALPTLPPPEERLKSRGAIPPPRPAYLPTNDASPLRVDKALYSSIQGAPRTLVSSHTVPPRSGLAVPIPSKSVIRISTPKGPQVADLNVWSLQNPRERFWAARTRQLHASHISTYDRLWSCLPYLRPLLTIIADSLAWYGVDETGGRVHDLLGTRCDPYVNHMLSSPGSPAEEVQDYDFHCHSNLVRAVLPFGLGERDVHDVINLFQVTGLDSSGRYFMNASPALAGDYIEFFAEVDLLIALSACPGGDLSRWGFGSASEQEMRDCCRELRIDVFKLTDEETVLRSGGWSEPTAPAYKGMHGMNLPLGEGI